MIIEHLSSLQFDFKSLSLNTNPFFSRSVAVPSPVLRINQNNANGGPAKWTASGTDKRKDGRTLAKDLTWISNLMPDYVYAWRDPQTLDPANQPSNHPAIQPSSQPTNLLVVCLRLCGCVPQMPRPLSRTANARNVPLPSPHLLKPKGATNTSETKPKPKPNWAQLNWTELNWTIAQPRAGMNEWMNELSPAQRSSEEIPRYCELEAGIEEMRAWERRRCTEINWWWGSQLMI